MSSQQQQDGKILFCGILTNEWREEKNVHHTPRHVKQRKVWMMFICCSFFVPAYTGSPPKSDVTKNIFLLLLSLQKGPYCCPSLLIRSIPSPLAKCFDALLFLYFFGSIQHQPLVLRRGGRNATKLKKISVQKRWRQIRETDARAATFKKKKKLWSLIFLYESALRVRKIR